MAGYQLEIYRHHETGAITLHFEDSLEGRDETFEMAANGNCYHTSLDEQGNEVVQHDELHHCLETFLDRVEARDNEADL
jgi:hypothetical protein